MVMTAVKWSSPPVPALLDLLETLPPKLGLSPEAVAPCSWDDVREITGLYPALGEVPALEADGRHRHRKEIVFVRAYAHPLASELPDDPLGRGDCAVTARRSGVAPAAGGPAAAVFAAVFAAGPSAAPAARRAAGFVKAQYKRARPGRTARKPTFRHAKTSAARTEPVCETREDNGPEIEMTTWQERRPPASQSLEPAQVSLPRFNRDFLRMFIAERNMYEHGKIRYMSCAPLLPPRARESLNPQCTLGVRHSWNKTYRRREWTSWRPNDLTE